MRRSVFVGALLVGAVIGYTATVALGGQAIVQPSATPLPGPATTGESLEPTVTTSAPTTDAAGATSTSQPDAFTSYLLWSTGGLPRTLTEDLVAIFDQVSLVRADSVELGAGDAVIPLDALAIDPAYHRPFDPAGLLDPLKPGTVILGETSARLRRVAVGDLLTFGDTGYEVVAIVPDETIAAAEIVFAVTDSSHPVSTVRYALVRTNIPRPEFEATVRSMYDGPAPMRIRSEGETPWLRHGDAVLPQALIKQALGEFSYTNRVGSDFEQSRHFRDEWIVTAEVPILGEVVCHRIVTDMLIGAMGQLIEEGLTHLVDPNGFAGCWNPRFTRTLTGTSAGLSRHSWGAAVDINAPTNPYGSDGTQDPRLVAIMQSWGFTWGGDWLVPDPMHFEFGGEPQASR